MAREHEHLSLAGLIGDELHQHLGRGPGPAVVEVHQRVVDDDGEMNSMPLQIADERQAEGEEHLLARPAAEAVGIPGEIVGVVDLEPGFVDRGRDPGVVPLGQPHQPARGLAEHRRLMIAGEGGARRFEHVPRRLQRPAAVELPLEIMLEGGDLQLQALGGVILRRRLDTAGSGLPRLPRPVERFARGDGGEVGLGDPLVERHLLRPGHPLLELGQVGEPAAGVDPGPLSALGFQPRLLDEGATIDERQKLLLGLDVPAGDDLAHSALGELHPRQRLAVAAAGADETGGHLATKAVEGRLAMEPLAELLELVERRPLGGHVALDEELLDLMPHRRKLLAAEPGLFRSALTLLVEGQQRGLVPGELADVVGGEGGGEGTRLERLSPAGPGGRATLERPGKILLGSFEPIGEEMERALARGQGLEPFDFALGRDEPAVDRRGVFPRPAFHRSAEGFEFLVEKSALRCGVVALLPDHRYLLAGRLEAIAGGPVERPGHHRRQPRAHKPQRCKSPGERPGDGGRQKEPREDHRCSGDEHRAQPEEPFERDQLPAEMEGHVAIEGGE